MNCIVLLCCFTLSLNFILFPRVMLTFGNRHFLTPAGLSGCVQMGAGENTKPNVFLSSGPEAQCAEWTEFTVFPILKTKKFIHAP